MMMVWQAHEKNEWSIAIEDALGPYFLPTPRDREHFSLADVDVVGLPSQEPCVVGVAIDADVVFHGPRAGDRRDTILVVGLTNVDCAGGESSEG